MTAPIGMPERTMVAGIPFTVETSPGIHIEDGDGDDAKHYDVLGLCRSDAQVITIATEQGPDRLRETFLHEHLHAMFDAAGLRDTLTFDQDESVAKRLAPILLQFLRVNRQALFFMLRETP